MADSGPTGTRGFQEYKINTEKKPEYAERQLCLSCSVSASIRSIEFIP